MRRWLCVFTLIGILLPPAVAQKTAAPAPGPMALQVRSEFLYAWNAYKQYAWGHDELTPLSKGYHDWHSKSLLMTPVDALDTMIIMGLTDEADKTREFIATNLSFDQDIEVKNFEITIRLLGGLLSSYQMTGDKRLLDLADNLGNRLLPVFNSPTGMPYMFVNLKTGKTRGAESNPAEIGTLLLEFGTLSKLTGKPIYYDKAKSAVVALYSRRSKIGLVGSTINVETGQWIDTTSHISGGIDSYYEYLLKSWLLFDDKDCKKMWESSVKAVDWLPVRVREARQQGGMSYPFGPPTPSAGTQGLACQLAEPNKPSLRRRPGAVASGPLTSSIRSIFSGALRLDRQVADLLAPQLERELRPRHVHAADVVGEVLAVLQLVVLRLAVRVVQADDQRHRALLACTGSPSR